MADMRLVSALALLMCIATCNVVFAGSQAILELEKTRLVGFTNADGKIESYLGVPFAQPPVGALRWRAPRPVRYSGAITLAQSYAPACYQGDHITRWYRGVIAGFGGDPASFDEPIVSEDCLYLNLWRPAKASRNPLPVIVYVHGGSNRGGWSWEPNYIGENLARRGVIVVSVAYRLGVFGFLAHPELNEENFALRDLVASLRWIQAHIAVAGGDPGNVTIMGESSGASNISQLLAVPEAAGLFRRMIHQSAGWVVRERTDRNQALADGKLLQRALESEGVEDMRAIPPERLNAVAGEVYADRFLDPVVDGHILPVSLPESLAENRLHKVDLLIGSNADEWKMYLDSGATLGGWIEANLAQQQAGRVQKYFSGSEDPVRALDILMTAFNYVCPSMLLASKIDALGGQAWMYYFSRQRDGDKAATMGAYHGAELPYVFDTHDDWLPTAAADNKLSASMMSYWVNFARSGDPNGEGLESWPRFTGKTPGLIQLDQSITAIRHPSEGLCRHLAAGN